jgi:hypothetical protein
LQQFVAEKVTLLQSGVHEIDHLRHKSMVIPAFTGEVDS